MKHFLILSFSLLLLALVSFTAAQSCRNIIWKDVYYGDSILSESSQIKLAFSPNGELLDSLNIGILGALDEIMEDMLNNLRASDTAETDHGIDKLLLLIAEGSDETAEINANNFVTTTVFCRENCISYHVEKVVHGDKGSPYRSVISYSIHPLKKISVYDIIDPSQADKWNAFLDSLSKTQKGKLIEKHLDNLGNSFGLRLSQTMEDFGSASYDYNKLSFFPLFGNGPEDAVEMETSFDEYRSFYFCDSGMVVNICLKDLNDKWYYHENGETPEDERVEYIMVDMLLTYKQMKRFINRSSPLSASLFRF